MRCLLIGNYGVGNLGDEVLRKYFLITFTEVEWVVVTCHGELCRTMRQNSECRTSTGLSVTHIVPRLPFGLRSLVTPWWRTVREYWRADSVVFGGGSLFTDSESIKAPLIWWWHACLAWIFGKPIFLAFQGVGPFRTYLGASLTKWVVKRAKFISVRDHSSFERVKKWTNNVVESFDPVFHSLSLSRERARVRVSEKRDILVLIPRSNSDDTFLHRAQDIYKTKSFYHVLILSLQPDRACEKAVCKKVQEHIPSAQILSVHSLNELSRIIESASFVFSERYHGALAALVHGIHFETVSQTQGDKFDALRILSKTQAIKLVQDGDNALRLVLLSGASQNV